MGFQKYTIKSTHDFIDNNLNYVNIFLSEIHLMGFFVYGANSMLKSGSSSSKLYLISSFITNAAMR